MDRRLCSNRRCSAYTHFVYSRKSSDTRPFSRKAWEPSSVGATCVTSAFALVCHVIGDAAIRFEATCLSAGFAVSSAVTTTRSCAMLIGARSGRVVTVSGGMSVVNAVKEIAISESGYYINCKRWNSIGGPSIIEIINSNGDHQRIPHLGGGYIFRLD